MKGLVEKQTKVSMKEMARQKSHKNIKIDKALAAFKVKTILVSFLQFVFNTIKRLLTLTTADIWTERSSSTLPAICRQKIGKNYCEVLTLTAMAELISMNLDNCLINEVNVLYRNRKTNENCRLYA